MDILSAVALVKNGIERILSAFTDAASETGHRDRFWIIVEGLKEYENGPYQLPFACISLLNCLITNNEDFDQRFHLRSEIYRTADAAETIRFGKIATDVEKLIQEEKFIGTELENETASVTPSGRPLSVNASAVNIQQQTVPIKIKFLSWFNTFFCAKDNDFEEFFSRFENIRFDFDNVDECFKILRNSVVDTPVEPLFLSIIQLLLYIRDDTYTK